MPTPKPIARRRRVVIEMDAGPQITDKQLIGMMSKLIDAAPSSLLRSAGVLPSSVKVKSYSRVVAAEYGAVPGDSLDGDLS